MLPSNLRKFGCQIILCSSRQARVLPAIPRTVQYSSLHFQHNHSRGTDKPPGSSNLSLELLSVYIGRQDLFHSWVLLSRTQPSNWAKIPSSIQLQLLSLLHKVRDPANLSKMLALLPYIFENKKKAYSMVIEKACHQKKFELALELIQKMVKSGLTPNAKTIHVLVTRLEENSQGSYAQTLISSLSSFDSGSDITAYAELHKALGQDAASLEEVRKIIGSVTKPYSFLYFLGVAHFAKHGRYKEAQALFSDMLHADVKPNIAIFTELMKAYHKGADQPGCIHTFERMQHFGITPDVKAYSLLMQTYGATGNYKNVMKLFNRMMRTGLVPDMQAFSIITKVMVDYYQYDEALRIFEMINASKMSRNLHYYNVIIQAFEQKYGTSGISTICKLMASQELKPNVYIYTSMIDLYAKSSDLKTAVGIFEEMRKAGITPNQVTYGALIDGFAKASNIQAIKDLYKRMLDDKVRPDTVLINTIMDAYNRLGDGEKVNELWNSFRSLSLTPDAATLSIFLDSCTFNNHLGLGYQAMKDLLHDQLAQPRSRPTFLERRNFHRFFNLLAKKGDFNEFIPTLEAMNTLKVTPAKGNLLLLLSHLIYAERPDLVKKAKRIISSWCPAVLPSSKEIDRFLVNYRPPN